MAGIFLPAMNALRVGELRREDARAFECESEVEHIGRIVREGSSADRQEDIYRLARLDGADEGQALRSVVDAILEETERGAGGMAQAQGA